MKARVHTLEILFLIATVITTFVFYFARVPLRFDFFDMSGFMDAGYRVMIGQQPYTDFLYNSGPVHLYLLAFFFKIFGFGLTASQIHVSVITSIATVFLYFFMRSLTLRWIAAVTAFCFSFMYYGASSFPWYDQNAYFFFIISLFIGLAPELGLKSGVSKPVLGIRSPFF